MHESGQRRAFILGLLLLSGCTVTDDLGAGRRQTALPSTADARDAAMAASHLRTLEMIARGTPAEQAELAEDVRKQAASDPTLFNRLRHALVIGLPGHPASDPPAAREALGALLATPEMMLPTEVAFARVMLHELDARIALAGRTQLAAASAGREESERAEALNRRLQLQSAENARLRQELAEALAKLEAVAALERNIAERRTSPERPP